MNRDKEKALVFLDPGLVGKGGHHDSVALSAEQYAKAHPDGPAIYIAGHRNLPDSFSEKCPHIEIEPFFRSEFYRYYAFEDTETDLAGFIVSLSREYRSALRAYCEKGFSRIVFVFHSMDYAHAEALALALASQSFEVDVELMALQMYHPFRRAGQPTLKGLRRYKFAFGRLADNPQVRLFGADWEIASEMSYLLGRRVPVHPCLLPLRGGADRRKADQHLLYVGDAKREKGFLELPDILRALQAAGGCRSRLVIQYTLSHDDPEFVDCSEAIADLASQMENVRLIREYLEEDDLAQLITESRAIVMNYDPEVYQYKSSGLIWLAAYYGLHIFLGARSGTGDWLSRESQRLGASYSRYHGPAGLDFERAMGAGMSRCSDRSYRAILFSSFFGWLAARLNKESITPPPLVGGME